MPHVPTLTLSLTLTAALTACGPVNNFYKEDTGTVEAVPGPPVATIDDSAAAGGEVEFVDATDPAGQDAMLEAEVDAIEPLPEPEPAPLRTYTIQKGDSYWKIAKEVYGDPLRIKDIEEANPDIDPKKLKIGDEIVLPE